MPIYLVVRLRLCFIEIVKCREVFSNTNMILDGGVVVVGLSKVVAGAPQLITIGTDKTVTIWDTISFKVLYCINSLTFSSSLKCNIFFWNFFVALAR